MKKSLCVLLLCGLLAGCTAEPVFEEVRDSYSGKLPQPAELHVVLPEDASVLTQQGSQDGQLYFCDGYTLTTQTLSGGDLERSLRLMTGYGSEELTLMETDRDGIRCVTCAWTSAGEDGDQVGRLLLLDDGAYHYVVTVMADADRAGSLREEWAQVFEQVSLWNTDP